MQPLWKIIVKNITDSRDLDVLEAESLSFGHHLISFNGFEVPITIANEEVIVHVSKAEGKLDNATLYGMGDSWDFEDRESISEVHFKPEEGDTILHVFGDEPNPSLLVKSLEEKPTPYWVSKERQG